MCQILTNRPTFTKDFIFLYMKELNNCKVFNQPRKENYINRDYYEKRDWPQYFNSIENLFQQWRTMVILHGNGMIPFKAHTQYMKLGMEGRKPTHQYVMVHGWMSGEALICSSNTFQDLTPVHSLPSLSLYTPLYTHPKKTFPFYCCPFLS